MQRGTLTSKEDSEEEDEEDIDFDDDDFEGNSLIFEIYSCFAIFGERVKTLSFIPAIGPPSYDPMHV